MALGLDRASPAVTLGHPLDLVVGVRLDPGEVLNAECVSADVTTGDTALPRYLIATTLENVGGAAQVRVRTQVPIDEPVLAVRVTVGCEAKISRRFTLFPDPPGLSMRPVPPVVVAQVQGPAVTPPPPAPPATAASAPESPKVAARPAGAASRTETPPPPRPREPAQTPPVKPAAAERPRLRLDAPVVTPVASAAAVAAAASAAEREAALRAAEAAASAAQAAASAAAARLAALEKELVTMRKDSQAQRELMERLTRRLAESEDAGRWQPVMLVALLVLALLVGWLAWRLRQAQAARDSAWWGEQSAGPPAETAVEGQAATAAAAEALPDTAPSDLHLRSEGAAVAAAAAARSATGRIGEPAAPAAAGGAGSEAPPRDVSIEELLDLEQQAEFFVVLGEDEAAIDLLVAHLRSTGGTVPLPYLKLLEIYRRRGDQASYDRMRDRFNQRFSAMAPEWGTDLNDGHALEDYPVVMAQIERVWAKPVDAMAILETLLFRTDTGAVFDLPAYREVLFLYTLARDLHERSGQKQSHVDVLLPLADGSGYFATTPRPFFGERPRREKVVDIPIEPQPTAPVDLDLHPLDAPTSSELPFVDVKLAPDEPDRKRSN